MQLNLSVFPSTFEKDLYRIVKKGKIQATIYLNYQKKMKRLLILPKTSKKDTLEILKLAASYITQYSIYDPRDRNPWADPPSPNSSDRSQSVMLMSFASIPKEIQQKSRDELLPILARHEVDLVFAVYSSLETAIQAAIQKTKVPGLTFEISSAPYSYDQQVGIKFSVRKPYTFTFWKSEWMPSDPNTALNIIPSYHPTMKRWHQEEAINGDTDACIGNNLVRCIYAPRASQALKKGGFSASWSHINHPYKAIGRSFDLRLIEPKMLSQDSVDLLAKLLRSALNLDNTYIAIIGGFDAPLSYSANKVRRLGIRSPYPRADYGVATAPITRGSEAHCVWAYRVLKEEGEINRAFIPFWFIQERWLQIYEGEEIQHGVY